MMMQAILRSQRRYPNASSTVIYDKTAYERLKELAAQTEKATVKNDGYGYDMGDTHDPANCGRSLSLLSCKWRDYGVSSIQRLETRMSATRDRVIDFADEICAAIPGLGGADNLCEILERMWQEAWEDGHYKGYEEALEDCRK
jgi:hypothetical protein